MSNVLIGIIGVILFIGLALAGALFLGDRFTQTRNTSMGAATIQAVDQVGNAINLYNVDGGARMQAGTSASILAPSFLKTLPGNPTGGGAHQILTANAAASGDDARLVVMKLAGASLEVCKAISRQTTGGQDTVGLNGIVEANSAAEMPKGPTGCFFVKTAFGALDANGYYAFSRP